MLEQRGTKNNYNLSYKKELRLAFSRTCITFKLKSQCSVLVLTVLVHTVKVLKLSSITKTAAQVQHMLQIPPLSFNVKFMTLVTFCTRLGIRLHVTNEFRLSLNM